MPPETPTETKLLKAPETRISLPRLFKIWFGLGIESFGGGSTTFALIQRAVVDRHGWMGVEEFSRYWAVSQVAPGINLFGLTILLGRHIAGFGGAVVCMLGLIVPSAAVTILMAAGYAWFSHFPALQSAVKGVIPATVGLGAVSTCRILFPLLKRGYGEGALSFGVLLLLLIASMAAVARGGATVYLVLIGAGVLGGVLYGTIVPPLRPKTEEEKP